MAYSSDWGALVKHGTANSESDVAAGETPLEEIVRLSEACEVGTYPSAWTGGRHSLVDE